VSQTIEPYRGEFAVYEHGVYPQSSVLAGQARRVFLASFERESEARAAYPRAVVLEHSSRPWRPRNETLEELSGLSPLPPTWFDEGNAGESW